MTKKRIMSGMRPTGKLHLGHYMGVLKNWLKFQSEYDCFFCIADWHALTTKFDKTDELKQNVVDVALDWLACGINPESIYLQSLVPQTAELHLYFSMITPQNWLERDPNLKDKVKALRSGVNVRHHNVDVKTGSPEELEKIKKQIIQEAQDARDITYGFLGYPVLQTADILSFNASLVPIGKDQTSHLELSRDIARRFNHIYNAEFLNEPKPVFTETPLLPGLDGQKMGKSFNNDIKLADDEGTTTKKIMKGLTDTARVRRDDPGTPDNCGVIYPYYKIFAPQECDAVAKECEGATRGCADCKRQLAAIINEQFRPIREKRAEYAKDLAQVHKIIEEGSARAEAEAAKVLKEVKQIIKMY